MDDAVKRRRERAPVGSGSHRARRAGAALALALVAGGLVPIVSAPPAHAGTSTCTTNGWFDSTGPKQVLVPKDAVGNPRCVMGVGNQGVAVRTLQQTLAICYRGIVTVDGVFGPQTRDALKVAQGVAKVRVDGVYGPETAGAIDHAAYTVPHRCYRALISSSARRGNRSVGSRHRCREPPGDRPSTARR